MNRSFDLLFWPLRAAGPIYGLIVISVLTGLAMVIAFRYTSNQKAIRRAKDRIQAHLLEVRLFQDQAGVVLRAYARILRWTLTYMKHSLRPLAIVLLPMALLLLQLDLHLSRIPLRPHQYFLLKARLVQVSALDQISLRLPEGLALSAPPLRIPAEKEVDWRIQAKKYGEFAPEVLIEDKAYAKEIRVSTDISRLSRERSRGGILEWLLNPGERPLPADGPLEVLEVSYPPRQIELGSIRIHWLVLFFILTIISGFALKTVLGIEL